VESFKDKTFNGKVTKISTDGRGEGQRHDLRSSGSINNPGGELKAAMTATPSHLESTRTYCRFRRVDLYDKDKKASVEIPDESARKASASWP